MTEHEPSRIRAGDADRERVVDALRGHHEAGRLDAEEFGTRMEAALGARYLDELPPLQRDLPTGDTGDAGDAAPSSSPRGSRAAACGGPGWARRGGFWAVVVPLLLVAAVAGSVAALAQGRFPWPLLWAGLLLFWLRPWAGARRRRRGGGLSSPDRAARS